MNYSSILVVVVTILSSCEVYSMRYNDPLNNMYNNPPYGNPNHEVVDIGNGVNRRNFVTIEDNQPDQFGNRFGGGSRTNNIGNGAYNRNTVVLGGGSEGAQTYDSWNNGGTTVVRNRNNGMDVFNVGYGQGNQNRVSIDGRPLRPDCYGSSCGNVPMTPRKASNGGGKNQMIYPSLFLSLFSICYILM